jgi:FMN reductase
MDAGSTRRIPAHRGASREHPKMTELVALNGSPSSTSKTHALAAAAIELAGAGTLINVGDLGADALLMRGEDPNLTDALSLIALSRRLVLVTPVYRATYSGMLKLVLDLLPTDALSGTGVVLCATGASPAHFLSLDTGLRAAVASLAGWSVPTVVYATGPDFSEGNVPLPPVLATLGRALEEAKRVS